MTTLSGKLVSLRILQKTDIETTTQWLNSDYISNIMGYLPVFSLSQQYDWYEKLKVDQARFVFAIIINQSQKHIGNIALGNIDYINSHAMFSIFIAQENSHKKGFGTESTKLLLNFAFNRINLNKIYLQTSSRFTGAIKMYEKIGFKKDGVMRDHFYFDGKYEDKIIYSLLKKEFYVDE